MGKSCGATHAIALDSEDLHARLSAALDDQGADVVLVCNHETADLQLALGLAAIQGRIIIEGHFDPQATIALAPFDVLVRRALTLKGNRGFTTPDYTRAHQLLTEGVVEVKPLLSRTFPLRDWESAFDHFTDPNRQTVQVLVKP